VNAARVIAIVAIMLSLINIGENAALQVIFNRRLPYTHTHTHTHKGIPAEARIKQHHHIFEPRVPHVDSRRFSRLPSSPPRPSTINSTEMAMDTWVRRRRHQHRRVSLLSFWFFLVLLAKSVFGTVHIVSPSIQIPRLLWSPLQTKFRRCLTYLFFGPIRSHIKPSADHGPLVWAPHQWLQHSTLQTLHCDSVPYCKKPHTAVKC
jgi:hypothetical protein